MKTTKQLLAFGYEFEGKPRWEIADLTGIKENTLNSYLAKNGRWHKEYNVWCKGELEVLQLQYQHKALEAALEAMHTLSRCLNSKNQRVALSAAKYVLDITGFKDIGSDLVKKNSEDESEKMVRFFENLNIPRQ